MQEKFHSESFLKILSLSLAANKIKKPTLTDWFKNLIIFPTLG